MNMNTWKDSLNDFIFKIKQYFCLHDWTEMGWVKISEEQKNYKYLCFKCGARDERKGSI